LVGKTKDSKNQSNKKSAIPNSGQHKLVSWQYYKHKSLSIEDYEDSIML